MYMSKGRPKESKKGQSSANLRRLLPMCQNQPKIKHFAAIRLESRGQMGSSASSPGPARTNFPFKSGLESEGQSVVDNLETRSRNLSSEEVQFGGNQKTCCHKPDMIELH